MFLFNIANKNLKYLQNKIGFFYKFLNKSKSFYHSWTLESLLVSSIHRKVSYEIIQKP